MEKKEYQTPDIEVNAFAQFENVYTACNKNPAGVCIWDPSIDEPGPEHSHHQKLLGITS